MVEGQESDAQLDARLAEIDRSIADLQRQRQELLRSRKPVGATGPASTPGGPSSAPPTPDDKTVEKAMKMLEWRSFKKREGEWTFMRDMKGNLVEDLQGITDFVDQLRKGKQLVVGKYRYSASEDKFLNRYPA